MNKEKTEIEELAEAIFQNCQCGLFFSEAEKIADFVINKQGYRKASVIFEKLEYLSMDGRIPMNGYYREFKKECTESEVANDE